MPKKRRSGEGAPAPLVMCSYAPDGFYPKGGRRQKWCSRLAAAQDWVLARQDEGKFCAVDEDDRRWWIHRSRREGHLYYSREQVRVAHKDSLVLSPPSPVPPPPVVVFAPPPRVVKDTPPTEVCVGRAIGRGTFSTVFMASVEGKPLALKRSMGTRSLSESLLRDEHFLRVLDGHDGVVRVIAAYQDSAKRRCLLLPVAEGDMHTHRPSDEAGWLAMCRQLAAALTYVHSRSVVHLDVKPQNVLVFNNGHVRLADFGSSLRRGHPMDSQKLYEYTRPYRPPELLFSAAMAADPAMDLWALGAALWDVWPSEQGHPLIGAQNAVEQVVLVVALVGCCPESTGAWGAPTGELDGFLSDPDSAPSVLKSVVVPLLRAVPRRRSMNSLLLSNGPDKK